MQHRRAAGTSSAVTTHSKKKKDQSSVQDGTQLMRLQVGSHVFRHHAVARNFVARALGADGAVSDQDARDGNRM